MADKVRIGIVGTGGMANAHAGEYAKIPEAVLTSCLDVVPGRAEAFAEKHGFAQTAESLEQLLDQVDAVAVVTPDKFHAQPSIEILRAGKHLLCEKPLTTSLAEAREVAKAAREAAKSGTVHMINFSYRESAAFQRAMEVVRAGQLGRLRHIHSFYLQSWLSSDIWGNWAREAMVWRLRSSQSGGVLGDIGCHILDLTTGVVGEVRAVRCDLRTFPKILKGKEVTEFEGQPLDANDSAVIELEFLDGSIGIVHTTRWATGHANHLRCEVHGTEGALRFDLDKSYQEIDLCIGEDVHKANWVTEQLEKTPNNYQRFVNAIVTGQPDQPDVLRGAQIQAYLDACERSAKSGRWETVESWLPE
jgi:predicted dehydrogenase